MSVAAHEIVSEMLAEQITVDSDHCEMLQKVHETLDGFSENQS